jgi:N-6 DNA methylase
LRARHGSFHRKQSSCECEVIPAQAGTQEPDKRWQRLSVHREALRSAGGDVFGRMYEYFLMKFAMQGAQDNGELFTPPSLVHPTPISGSKTLLYPQQREAGELAPFDRDIPQHHALNRVRTGVLDSFR